MDKLIPLLVMLPLIALFIFSYILNKKTPLPPGCEKLNCEGCKIVSCSHNDANKEEQNGLS